MGRNSRSQPLLRMLRNQRNIVLWQIKQKFQMQHSQCGTSFTNSNKRLPLDVQIKYLDRTVNVGPRKTAYLDTPGVRTMRRTRNEKLRMFYWDSGQGQGTGDGRGRARILDRILTIRCGGRDERAAPICGIGLQYSLPFLQPGAVDTD